MMTMNMMDGWERGGGGLVLASYKSPAHSSLEALLLLSLLLLYSSLFFPSLSSFFFIIYTTQADTVPGCRNFFLSFTVLVFLFEPFLSRRFTLPTYCTVPTYDTTVLYHRPYITVH